MDVTTYQGTIGGKIITLTACLPTIGDGALKARDDAKLLGTSKESSLLQAANSFYKTFSIDCARVQITVDMFLFSPTYTDVASLSEWKICTELNQLFRGPFPYTSTPGTLDRLPAKVHRRIDLLLPGLQRQPVRGCHQVRDGVRYGLGCADCFGGCDQSSW